ncbi:pimeloyl-ACP methyl ester carboxylesterase [Hydrogenispora ethanolica]|uniref:Pimeloyl-ACP methyl ester carboxylesterase n=1 Tax=Hydrogenispora ethanolica TaxID=1082276 RepID=A0A4V6NGR8_HYDET|nr:alpha/beta hydrolase [Hydrogenispora ethanolica]TCL61457.1 pimeloyl-ACP methyl ester carboxylesterase [Hydrogenispora ethanolica]
MKTKLAFKSQEGKTAILKSYDSLLENWPLPNEKFYVKTRYGSTFIIATGEKDAPPLILLHGSAFNSMMWIEDSREYSRNYRVYAIDIPGEPGRSDETQLSFSGPALVEWLLDVFSALKLEKASLLGISLGAWLSTKFSVCYPEKVDKLVLLCPAGIGPQRISFLFKALFYMLFGEKGMAELYKKINGNQPLPEVVLKYQKLLGKNFNFRREVIPLFSDLELKQLSMPVILFVGEKDIMLHSAVTAKRLGDLLPHAKINVLPGAGHTLINLTDRISAFLASNAQA